MSLLCLLGVFCYTLANIKPSQCLTLKSIQLLAIAKTKLIDSSGIDIILQPFMTCIEELETVHL
jgi:hypothetical protein